MKNFLWETGKVVKYDDNELVIVGAKEESKTKAYVGKIEYKLYAIVYNVNESKVKILTKKEFYELKKFIDLREENKNVTTRK